MVFYGVEFVGCGVGEEQGSIFRNDVRQKQCAVEGELHRRGRRHEVRVVVGQRIVMFRIEDVECRHLFADAEFPENVVQQFVGG